MKRTLSTLILAGIVVLITGTFCFAEFAAAGVENFPYFHLGCLIVGGMIIVSLKQKYREDLSRRGRRQLRHVRHPRGPVHGPRGRRSQEPPQLRKKKGSADNALHPGPADESISEGENKEAVR